MSSRNNISARSTLPFCKTPSKQATLHKRENCFITNCETVLETSLVQHKDEAIQKLVADGFKVGADAGMRYGRLNVTHELRWSSDLSIRLIGGRGGGQGR